MTVMQDDIPIYENITPEMVFILGAVATILVVVIGLYLGYKKNAHEPLYSVKVLTQIAVFSALGFVISFVDIPLILDTKISFQHITDWSLAFAYGPYVGAIAGFIVGLKGMLTGNWTGSASGVVFGIVIGTCSMYINPEKRGRPMYMILIMVVVSTWSWGLVHMWYAFAGLVVPFLIILNLLLSMINNIIYGIILEIIIHIEQFWDPLTEESTLQWYQDDYQEPAESIQTKERNSQLLILIALLTGWLSVIWLTPPSVYAGIDLGMFNQPLLFILMMGLAIIILIFTYFKYFMNSSELPTE